MQHAGVRAPRGNRSWYRSLAVAARPEPSIVLELTVAHPQTFGRNGVKWGLDKGTGAIRMGLISTMQPCNHGRTEILARRDGVDYVRCLECDQVFEAEDLESVPTLEEDDQPAA
jgi:hypothetical protein